MELMIVQRILVTNCSVLPAAAVRLHYLRVMYRTQVGPQWNPTLAETDVAIATGVEMSIAIMVSCVPFLRPLIDALQTGWSNSDVRHGLGFTVIYSKSSASASKLRSFEKGSVIRDST